MKQEIGVLLHLYLDEIQVGEPTEISDFLINEAAQAIQDAGGRNWIPLVVKQTGAEEYRVVANCFVLAAAEKAGLDRVWCVIADDSPVTERSARILAQEIPPKINLATATRDRIKAALRYLKNYPASPLAKIDIAIATDRIASTPCQYWQESLVEVTKLKCGITRGKKLDAFKSVFYTIPEPLSDEIADRDFLKTLTVAALKKMAKKRGVSGYSKLKKDKLVEILGAG